VEVQVGSRKSELGVACRNRLTLLVLGHKPEGGLASQGRSFSIGAFGRREPSTARDKAGGRIHNDNLFELSSN
jgi:hypothetical protein